MIDISTIQEKVFKRITPFQDFTSYFEIVFSTIYLRVFSLIQMKNQNNSDFSPVFFNNNIYFFNHICYKWRGFKSLSFKIRMLQILQDKFPTLVWRSEIIKKLNITRIQKSKIANIDKQSNNMCIKYNSTDLILWITILPIIEKFRLKLKKHPEEEIQKEA